MRGRAALSGWRFEGREPFEPSGSPLILAALRASTFSRKGRRGAFVFEVRIFSRNAAMTDPAIKKRIVIVGSGFGGMAAAKALKGVDAEITLVDRTNHHPVQPLLYQVATAALWPDD